MGVGVGSPADRQDRMHLLIAAHLAGRVPGAARGVLRAAQDGVVRRQVDTEPPVAAAYEPFAVHPITV